MNKIIYSARDLIFILNESASDMAAHVEELRELDSQLGDGDLGITVDMARKALSDYLASPGTDDIGKLLAGSGMHMNKANPSTFGTLLSMAFMGAGKVAAGQEEDVSTL